VDRTDDEFCVAVAEGGPSARAGDEPIPGYRLLEPLGSGGFGEVWKCEVPGGLHKALKFVRGGRDLGGKHSPAAVELAAIQRIKSIRHPFLLSIDRLELRGDDLLIVTELADKSLHDVAARYRDQGLPGVPRDELLPLLAETAEALDVINFDHGLQHLDVKPRNLLLVGNHVKVADFGLVYSLHEFAAGQPMKPRGGVTLLYAAPEGFEGCVSRHSDQYSLAVVYQELLTGTFPFKGKSGPHQLMLQISGRPNLEALTAADRPAVARALSRDPERRFGSCLEFVQALFDSSASATLLDVGDRKRSTKRLRPPGLRPNPAAAPPSPASGGAPGNVAGPPPDTQGRADRADARPPEATPRGENGLLVDYEVLELLRQGPLGDVRRVRAADGRGLLARFLPGQTAADPEAQQRLATGLAALRHPCLPGSEVVRNPAGGLVHLTDVLAPTLRDRYQECVAQHMMGIPRGELLGYLHTAAEALDTLYARHGLQHLGLNPQTLLVRDGRLWLADFGLVQLAWLPLGQVAGPLNGRYSDPRLAAAGAPPGCDQYSLALIYAEMLTRIHPRTRRSRGKVDLSYVSTRDRDILARALHADPRQRFATCGELVRALEQATPRPATRGPEPRGGDCPPEPAAGPQEPPEVPGGPPPALDVVIADLLAVPSDAVVPGGASRTAVGFATRDGLEHRCLMATLPTQLVYLKLKVFRQQWGATAVERRPELYSFHVPGLGNLWQRCLGQDTGVLVAVQLEPVAGAQPRLSRVTVRVQPCGSGDAAAFQERGRVLIQSVLRQLQARTDPRTDPRCPFSEPVRVYPILPGQEPGGAIEGKCKDLARGGVGLTLPRAPGTDRVYLDLPTIPALAGFAIPVRIAWTRPRPDDWFDLGVSFLPSEELARRAPTGEPRP
jgi:serine/threonine protein kinase